MKINPDYKLRNVGGKNIIISNKRKTPEGIITVNETAGFILKMIEKGAETQEIITALAKECGVSENDVKDDVEGFISTLKASGIVE